MIPALQKISVVQCYIHHKTGKEFKISVPNTLNQKMLLEKAYMVASSSLV